MTFTTKNRIGRRPSDITKSCVMNATRESRINFNLSKIKFNLSKVKFNLSKVKFNLLTIDLTVLKNFCGLLLAPSLPCPRS